MAQVSTVGGGRPNAAHRHQQRQLHDVIKRGPNRNGAPG
jgi:hypothetical protein